MNQKKPSDSKEIVHWKEKTQMMSNEFYEVAREIFNNCGAKGNMTRTNHIK